jgi:transposase-like protein
MSQKKNKSIPSTRDNRTIPFPKQLIVQIVKEVEEGLSRKEACARHGMAYCTLVEWMLRFGSPVYQLCKRSHFSSQQRRSIIRAIREGRMTKDEASLIHKVGKKTLSTWLREAKQEDSELVCFNQNDMAVKQINYSGSDLQKELAQAQLKIKALETMIDIAEEQFKIAIRKKSGAKQ